MLKKMLPNFIREYLHWLKLRRLYPGTEFFQTVTVNEACKFGDHVVIHPGAEVLSSTFGRCSYVGPQAKVINASVGSFCSIAPRVIVGGYKHPSDRWVSTSPAFYSSKKQCGISFTKSDLFQEQEHTLVGNDVWMGYNALVFPGVQIGDGAIIGAGAVVTKNVESYSVVAGVPAKVLRKRFDPETIEWLLNFRWWEKPDEWLESHAKLFCNVEEFEKMVD